MVSHSDGIRKRVGSGTRRLVATAAASGGALLLVAVHGHVLGQRRLPGEPLGAHGALVGQPAPVLLPLVQLGDNSMA